MERFEELTSIVKEIIPALHREMGSEWCGKMLDRLSWVGRKDDTDKILTEHGYNPNEIAEKGQQVADSIIKNKK